MALRILVAIDESEFSRSAAKVAVDLASSLRGSELTALHVVNVVPASGNILKDLPGHLGFEPAVVSPEVNARHEQQGAAVLATVKEAATAAGIEVRTVLEHGAVVDRIVHWAAPFDLLILGIRGETESRFPGQGGGSVHNVLAGINTPTLLIPEGQTTLRSIALGYDGSAASKNAVQAIAALTGEAKLIVHAIYVTGDGRGGEVLNELNASLPNSEVHHHVVTSDDPVHIALARTAHEKGADVLAMGFQGHSPLKDFLFGSSTEYISQQTDLALFIAH